MEPQKNDLGGKVDSLINQNSTTSLGAEQVTGEAEIKIQEPAISQSVVTEKIDEIETETNQSNTDSTSQAEFSQAPKSDPLQIISPALSPEKNIETAGNQTIDIPVPTETPTATTPVSPVSLDSLGQKENPIATTPPLNSFGSVPAEQDNLAKNTDLENQPLGGMNFVENQLKTSGLVSFGQNDSKPNQTESSPTSPSEQNIVISDKLEKPGFFSRNKGLIVLLIVLILLIGVAGWIYFFNNDLISSLLGGSTQNQSVVSPSKAPSASSIAPIENSNSVEPVTPTTSINSNNQAGSLDNTNLNTDVVAPFANDNTNATVNPDQSALPPTTVPTAVPTANANANTNTNVALPKPPTVLPNH